MAKRKTHEEFVKEVYELFGDEFEVIGEYIDNTTKIHFKHTVCKTKFNKSPKELLRKRKCPKCSGAMRYTNEMIKEMIFDLVGDEYVALSKYNGMRNTIRMRHNCATCGNYEYNVEPRAFLFHNSRCPHEKCLKKRLSESQRKPVEEVMNAVAEKGFSFIEWIGEYKNKDSRFILECGNGHKNEYAVSSVLYKGSCKDCAMIEFGKRIRSCEDDVIEKITKNGFEFISFCDGEYINNKSRCLVKCKNGHSIENSASSLCTKYACRVCRESKGETEVARILNNINVKYERQYKMSECKHKKALPFDFAVFSDNKLLILIEYQGKQHYDPEANFGGDTWGFNDVSRNDQIKRDYCKSNNIPLLEIPYWDFDNIEEILKTTLNL